ncbi:hypothetical protein CsatA_013017 [Cannabis sativa]
MVRLTAGTSSPQPQNIITSIREQNATSEKKALEHKKEIAKRLGRPLIQTNSYEDDTTFEKQSALFALAVSDMESWLPAAWSSRVTFNVRGTIFCTDNGGALVDITAKSSAYLPLEEASIHRLKHVEEAGIVPALKIDFVVGANKGGVVAMVEGLRGFVPFSQISSVSHLTQFPNCEAL